MFKARFAALVLLLCSIACAHAHEPLNDAVKASIREGILLWQETYTCELSTVVEIDENGGAKSSLVDHQETMILILNRERLTVESEDLIMTSNVVVSLSGMHISKAYGDELIAHSNIGHLVLNKDGELFWNWSAFNWDSGSIGVVFVKGLCK